MAKREALKADPGILSSAQLAAREALQVTGQLLGDLKNAQMAYLRVGAKLRRVLEEKLYAVLHYPDIVSYAQERLFLGRTSLYRYLQVYAWVLEFHPEWLVKHPKGHIPDLADAADLIWIEHKLRDKNLDPDLRAELEDLRRKALDGKLRKGDAAKLRRRQHRPGDGLAALLRETQALRRHAAQIQNVPPAYLTHVEAAIAVLLNDRVVLKAGLKHFPPNFGERRTKVIA